MALPTIQRTWTIIPNIRITTNDGVVLAGVTGSMQKYLYTFKQVMTLSGSYTLKGSAANGTGAMDGVDRWPNAQSIFAGTADAKAAGGNTVAYPTGVLGDMAWLCLTDAGGADTVIAWQAVVGQPDTVCLMHSPGGLFRASTYHVSGACLPTASDEIRFLAPTLGTPVGCVSGPNDTTRFSADRILNFWIASDRRSFRVGPAVYSGTFGNSGGDLRWGVEQVQMLSTSGTVQWSGSWCFADRANNTQVQAFCGSYNTANTVACGGQASMTIGGVFRQVQLVRGREVFNSTPATFANVLASAQGGTSYYIWPVALGGLSSPNQGKFGNLIDWWSGDRVAVSPMDTYGTNNFVIVGTADGAIWPWDGSTTASVS